eukprot:gene29633-35769_t
MDSIAGEGNDTISSRLKKLLRWAEPNEDPNLQERVVNATYEQYSKNSSTIIRAILSTILVTLDDEVADVLLNTLSTLIESHPRSGHVKDVLEELNSSQPPPDTTLFGHLKQYLRGNRTGGHLDTDQPVLNFSKLAKYIELQLEDMNINDLNASLQLKTLKKTYPTYARATSATVSDEVLAGPATFVEVGAVKPLQLFRSHIDYCIRQIATRTMYAGYITMCQSSGYGKTRLVKEMSAHHVLVYICLRPSTATGWPRRSPYIADFILNSGALKNEAAWAAFMEALVTFLNCCEDTYFPAIAEGFDAVEAWGRQFVSQQSEDEKFQKSFWEAFLDFYGDAIKRPSKGKLDHWTASRSRAVLLCFDEASALLHPLPPLQ